MGWKKWPSWLKGGIIGGIIGILFYLLFVIIFYIGMTQASAGESQGWAQAILMLWSFYGILDILIFFILGLIIGAISGKISKGKGTFLSKGLKIGFWIGLIFAVLLLALWVRFEYNSIFGAGTIFALGIIILGVILGALIGFVVGKIKSKKK